MARSAFGSEDKPLGYLVNRVWPPESTTETTLDVIFFEGNVGRRKYLACKDTWVQRGKPDVWWPRDWLPMDFKSDIRVLLLQYSISDEAGVEGVVDEVQRLLVFSDRWNRGNTWKHPVVLVGHSLGCAVIEQLVVALHKRVKGKGCLNDESETDLAKMSKAFLVSLAGCFFYAAPWKGLVPSEELLKHVFGGLSYSRALFADLCLDSPKLNEVSKEFVKARSEHLKLMALREGFHTKGSTVVPPASMEDFAGPVVSLPDSNHEDACKPISKGHPIYEELVEFIRDVLSPRKDFDEPLSSSVSQTSPSEGLRSESTVKEFSSHPAVESIKYDVFINHRGPDTKLRFVTHLEDALKFNNISPFVDKSVEEGLHAFDEINAAIQTAPIQLAIFSPNYASSSYCLDELVDMLDRKRKHPQNVTFLPVFFNVEPHHLRCTHLFGTPFYKAFQSHDSSDEYSAERVSRWKKALYDALMIKGFELSRLGGDTNMLKHEIVARVQEILNPLPPSPGGSSSKKSPIPDPPIPEEIPFISTDRPLRVLILGKLPSVEGVVSHICGEGRRHTQVQNYVGLTESRSSSPPMCLFYSTETNRSDRETFDNVFKEFIKDRNSKSRAKRMVGLCLDAIYRRRRVAGLDLLPGSASRLHAVWYVCREWSDLPNFLWEDYMTTLSNTPLQVVVTAAPGAAGLEREYRKIWSLRSLLFPEAQEPEFEELVVRFDGSLAKELWRKCWQAKTRAEIRTAARVIKDVRDDLGEAGVAIPSQGVGNAVLSRKHSLWLGGEVLRQFFCEYWEVSSSTLIYSVLKETTTFIEQTPERIYRYWIQPGQFVKFCLQVAAMILHNFRDGNSEPRYVCDWPNSSLQELRPGIEECYARYFHDLIADRTYDKMKCNEIEALLQSIFERRDFNFDDLKELHSQSTVTEYPSFQKVVGLLSNLKKVVSGPSHFHANQCRILKEQLSLAKRILIEGKASRGVSSGGPSWPKLALTELLRVLKLGETLIKDCQYNKLCLKAYLRQGERAQAFAETLKAIIWCKSVVKFYHDRREQVSSTAMDEFPEVSLGDEEHKMLAKAADEDEMELQALLNSWIGKHPCSAKECGRPLREDQADNSRICLAAQIWARILNSEGDVEVDHTSVLWKTSQDALKDGIVIGTGLYVTVNETTWLGDKFVKKAFDRAPDEFELEVNALAKLSHPHIVKVSAYGVSPIKCFFLMDIMPGNLRKYMNKRIEQLRLDQPFSLSAAIDLMLQISEAMSYVNSKGMVHRDLKPHNILVKPVDDPELCKAGFVTSKLADFGLAKTKHFITSHSHSTPKNLGTSLWRAPELYKISIPLTDKAYPWQADVYSFGIVCSEILTGKEPFQDNDFKMRELYDLLVDRDNPLRPDLPKNCPPRLASLIRECWQTNPIKRPTFQEASRRLRNLKAIFMLTASESSI